MLNFWNIFDVSLLLRETLEETGIDQGQIRLYDKFVKVCGEIVILLL